MLAADAAMMRRFTIFTPPSPPPSPCYYMLRACRAARCSRVISLLLSREAVELSLRIVADIDAMLRHAALFSLLSPDAATPPPR